ncbi:MAG: hypothetical protein Q7K42_02425 [Candidatus Diapherotrites archaeon]|nr:hypothetical protein [Candidatus Diapherotrites archaeon]
MNSAKKILFIIFLLALVLRLGPVFLHNEILFYDSPYHMRIASIISEQGRIPEIDPTAGGRPYSYPPFYHLLLASISIYSGISLQFLAMYLLPFFSALTVLSMFLLVRKFSTDLHALISAFLVAVVPQLILVAYDSPENIVFFAFPLIILILLKKRSWLAGFFSATVFFWNILSGFFVFLPMLLVFRREKDFLRSQIFFLAIVGVLSWPILSHNFSNFEGFVQGVNFVGQNTSQFMLYIAIIFAMILLPVLYFQRQSTNPAVKYFSAMAGISFLALVSFFVSFALRPWEQSKIITLALIPLFALLAGKKFVKKILPIVLLGCVILGAFVSVQYVYPKTTSMDFKAISWLEQHFSEGKILAEPSMSESIINRTNLDDNLVLALYYETLPKQNYALQALQYLSDFQNSEVLEQTGTKYIVLNFEDDFLRDTKKIDLQKLSKVYSISYKTNCLFGGQKIGSPLCGYSETRIYEKS